MTLGMWTLVRVTFWAALIFTVACATAPVDVAPNALRSDKAEHFLAFYVLAILAAAAYPRTGLVWVGTSLSAFGALIEIAQAIPIVHRDASFQDWFVDTAAIIAALAPAILIAWRMGIKAAADLGAEPTEGPACFAAVVDRLGSAKLPVARQ
jgi:VanZ family protein